MQKVEHPEFEELTKLAEHSELIIQETKTSLSEQELTGEDVEIMNVLGIAGLSRSRA